MPRVVLSNSGSGLALPDGAADFFERLAPGAFAIGDVARDGLEGIGAVGEKFERIDLFEEALFEALGVLEALEGLSGHAEQQAFKAAGGFEVFGQVVAIAVDRIEHRRLAGGFGGSIHLHPQRIPGCKRGLKNRTALFLCFDEVKWDLGVRERPTSGYRISARTGFVEESAVRIRTV